MLYLYIERGGGRYIFCAFVGLDNEQYKMHGTYIKRVHETLHMLITYPFRILS
jgi:hypothetical protein